MLIPFQDCVSIIGKVNGVLHIGAHHAEEAQDYARSGVERVFWLEADYNLLDKIAEVSQGAGLKTRIVTGYAISNEDDQLVNLNITNNGQSSSILELGTHKTHYPHIHVVDKKEVKTRKMKTLLSETETAFDYEFINIDIQGAELMALQGFEDLLDSPTLKGIYLEINYKEVYVGCPIVTDIDKYLAKFGFYRAVTSTTPYDWGDALYVRIPEKEVELSYTNASHRGPGKVVTNLVKGLEALGVDIKPGAKNLGVLQTTEALLRNTDRKVLVGPNVFVLPSDLPQVAERFDNYIVPSMWVSDVYRTDLQKMENRFPEDKVFDIRVWSVGIDTDEWKPISKPKDPKKCFIYFKNRSEKDLEVISSVLKNGLGVTPSVLRYGNYSENDLRNACNENSFCVLLDNTESQGVAVMEILSMNVPILVFNMENWTSSSGEKFKASSVPYFDHRCGMIMPNHITRDALVHFQRSLPNFKPREYILEQHTLIQAAGEYMRCFND